MQLFFMLLYLYINNIGLDTGPMRNHNDKPVAEFHRELLNMTVPMEGTSFFDFLLLVGALSCMEFSILCNQDKRAIVLRVRSEFGAEAGPVPGRRFRVCPSWLWRAEFATVPVHS